MRAVEEIIRKPYVTEKSNAEIADGKYTFIVDSKATKTEIKQAAEKLFNVKVLSVNTINYEGKIKRVRLQAGRRPSWKKAIVKIDMNPTAGSFLTKGGKATAVNRKIKTSIEEFGATQ